MKTTTCKTLAAAILLGACAGIAAPAVAAGDAPKRSVGEYAGDALTTTKVKAALLKEQSTQSLSIKVKTVNGVVELSGRADDPAQIDSAVRVARGIEGVQDVKNDIQLKKAAQ
ncbi:BON domain-containing protein [Pigmentiphaga soli]|uniref:BON domain-containing protein n=1 Tax=Pigmentiphaga soli TaxID=1007095 RepID=A0ABP8GXF0_9BURK